MDDSGLIIQRQATSQVKPLVHSRSSPHSFATSSPSSRHEEKKVSQLEIILSGLSPSSNQLTYISLAGCSLSNNDIPAVVWQSLTGLVVANLSRNQLTAVPSELFTLATTPSLWSVDLSANELRFFPPLVHQRPMLGVLNLAGNTELTLAVFQEGIRGFVCGEVVPPPCVSREDPFVVRDSMLGILSVSGQLLPSPPQPFDLRCEAYHNQLRRKCRLWAQKMLLEQFKAMFAVNNAELPHRQQEIVFRSTADTLLRLSSALFHVASTNVAQAGGSFGESKTAVLVGYSPFASVNAALDGPPFGQEVWECAPPKILEDISHILSAWSASKLIPLPAAHCAAVTLLDSSEGGGDLAAIAVRYPHYAWYAVWQLLLSMRTVHIVRQQSDLDVDLVAHFIQNARPCAAAGAYNHDVPLVCEVPTGLKDLMRKRAEERGDDMKTAGAVDSKAEQERREKAGFRAMLFSRMTQTQLSIPPRVATPSGGMLDGSPRLGMHVSSSSPTYNVEEVLDVLSKYEHDTSFVHKDFFRANSSSQSRLKERHEAAKRVSSANAGRLTPIARLDVSLPEEHSVDSAAQLALEISRVSTSASRARMRASSGSPAPTATKERLSTSSSHRQSPALATVTMIDFLKSRGSFRSQNDSQERKILDALNDEGTSELIRREHARRQNSSSAQPPRGDENHTNNNSALVPQSQKSSIARPQSSLPPAWTLEELRAAADLLNGDRNLAQDLLAYIASRQRTDHSVDGVYRTFLAAFWVTAPQCSVDLATCGMNIACDVIDQCLGQRGNGADNNHQVEASEIPVAARAVASESTIGEDSSVAVTSTQYRRVGSSPKLIDSESTISQIPASPTREKPVETASAVPKADLAALTSATTTRTVRPSTSNAAPIPKLSGLPPRSSSAKAGTYSPLQLVQAPTTASHPFLVAAQEEMARQRLRAEIKHTMREVEDPVIEQERRRACSATLKNVRAGQFDAADQHMFIPAAVRDHLKGRPMTAPKGQL